MLGPFLPANRLRRRLPVPEPLPHARKQRGLPGVAAVDADEHGAPAGVAAARHDRQVARLVDVAQVGQSRRRARGAARAAARAGRGRRATRPPGGRRRRRWHRGPGRRRARARVSIASARAPRPPRRATHVPRRRGGRARCGAVTDDDRDDDREADGGIHRDAVVSGQRRPHLVPRRAFDHSDRPPTTQREYAPHRAARRAARAGAGSRGRRARARGSRAAQRRTSIPTTRCSRPGNEAMVLATVASTSVGPGAASASSTMATIPTTATPTSVGRRWRGASAAEDQNVRPARRSTDRRRGAFVPLPCSTPRPTPVDCTSSAHATADGRGPCRQGGPGMQKARIRRGSGPSIA